MAVIDIGAAAIDRGSYRGIDMATLVGKENPANDTGEITSAEVWFYSAAGTDDVWLGTFSASGDVLTCRDSESVGDVAEGSKQTYSGLSISVETGDYLGIHSKGEFIITIERDLSGDGYWYYEGECIDPTDSQTFSFSSSKTISLYGESAAAATYTKTVNITALLKETDTKTINLDAFLRATDEKTVNLDTLLRKAGITEAVNLDALLALVKQTKTVDLDVLLQALGITKTVALDILLRTADLKTIDLDTLIRKLGIPKTVALDALLVQVGTETIDLDALLRGIVEKTIDLDALLRKVGDAKTVDLDALIALVKLTQTVDIDTLLEKTDSKTIDLDTYLRALNVLQTVDLDALIQAVGLTKTVAIDVLLATIMTETIDLDVLLRALGITKTVALDALLRGIDSKTIALDILIEALGRVTIQLDVILRAYPSGALGYTIEIRDGSGNLLAVLENAHGINLTEQLNRPPMLDFSLPADDSKISHIDPDNEIWLRDYETGVLIKKFLISRRSDTRR